MALISKSEKVVNKKKNSLLSAFLTKVRFGCIPCVDSVSVIYIWQVWADKRDKWPKIDLFLEFCLWITECRCKTGFTVHKYVYQIENYVTGT